MTAGSKNKNDDWHNDDFLTLNESGNGEEDDQKSSQQQEDKKAAIASMLDLPPWMPTPPVKCNPLVRLHNEIVDFCALMEPLPEELKAREELVTQFKALAHGCFGKDGVVTVFGSQATGLLLPTSDIDVVIQLKEEIDDSKEKGQNSQDKKEMDNWDVAKASKKSPLQRLATALREEWLDKLEYLEVIEKTRVPLVKFTTLTGLSMDICFNQENGPKAAQLMKTYLQAMPPLRPLTFVMKYYLASRGLNEPYSGGIGSYLLQLMIVSFLQHRERHEFNQRRSSVYNLGCLLVEFLELYGIDMNYLTTGISVRHDGFYFSKGARDRREVYCASNPSRTFALAMENPLDPTMDVGKASFKMQLIQRSFDTAFKVLLAHVAEPPIPVPSILASILPASLEMYVRSGTSPQPKKEEEQVEADDGASDMKSPDRKRRRRV
eukprot:CAMPEP_0119029652 /NCGR_PEP_ID=MMETSP1176-20130426/40631_1 /TAXON_ID=265551 /ORGANISM="Synedropsis recta cf, Strain CCMP1620" /LENGTH=434 /DNA_ID=CAMNT_0006986003 /DNA_START=29 /DNA_END=1333 /DNA_ORIENTATION=+